MAIDVSIAIVRVVLEFLPAVEGDIVGIDQVNRRYEAAHRLTCKQPVQFIHHLPAMQVERLGHGNGLVGFFACMRKKAEALPSPADNRLMPSLGIAALVNEAIE